MKGLSVNLSMLFTEQPFLQRFDAAAKAGFKAVEFWFPYDHAPQDVRHALRDAGLCCVVINTPAGDVAAGDWGLSVHPDKQGLFRTGLLEAIDYAGVLGAENLHVMAGIVPTAAGVAVQFDAFDACQRTYVDNLRFATEKIQSMPLQLLVEPLNHIDRPGYFLSTLEQAVGVIASVGKDKLSVMWDIYHAQMQQGNLAAKIKAHSAYFGHVQLADVPGRHEPGTGEINWPFLLRELAAAGYQGWLGLEYLPTLGHPIHRVMQYLQCDLNR